MSRSPRQLLEEGAKLLEPLMKRHGFSFGLTEDGQGSGGRYAIGVYSRDERKLELHFRTSLGVVTYRDGDDIVSHAGYMSHLAVKEASYPGFSDDPLDGFRHLLFDLERFGDDFLAGDAGLMRAAAAAERSRIKQRGRELMISYSGDASTKSRARALFREGRYREVRELYRTLEFPERLSPAERKMFETAETRK